MADRHTIIVVEDPFVGNFMRVILERRRYHVVSTNRQDALMLLRSPAPEVSLLITNSPHWFVDFGARIPLLYTAACPDPQMVEGWRRCLSLSKPFQAEDLIKSVEALLSAV